MAQAKQAPKRKRRNAALPLLGTAGVSSAMTGGASATLPVANAPHHETGPQINLSEEEVSDVSLATFYVFDKESEGRGLLTLTRGGGGGCGGGGRYYGRAETKEDRRPSEPYSADRCRPIDLRS
jgi:hypothetical protein